MNKNVKNYLLTILQVYVTIVIALMVVDVTLLIILTFTHLKPITVTHIYNLDLIVCIMLFFVVLLTVIPKKDKIGFLKDKWILIPAIIPVDFILIGLLGFPLSVFISIIRLVHMGAMVASVNKISSSFIKFSKKTGLSYGIVILTLVFLLSSAMFFVTETKVNPEVKSYEDAAWYTVTTMTTTGYGDIVPITGFGRVLGVLMMITGVAFTGYATASVASSLIDKFRAEREKDREALIELTKKMNKDRIDHADEINGALKEILEKLDKK
ncbi:potassium channel family protein [Methanobacterium alcaliphilum]|uniref:potassium channel family protein n=1 Tax=Methanobacterium alcaliphilum TaxID=392018 RepID=UPI00200B9DE7|nr:potassium channel family protein [Methanobacterium alcaliphilum]MCK9150617.1 potassium channel family protein [Methanobacterium alcaliphilum]